MEKKVKKKWLKPKLKFIEVKSGIYSGGDGSSYASTPS